MAKKYNEDGMRLTDCCGACSTYDENGELYCKACFKPVPVGQGDGCEHKPHPDFKVIPAGSTVGRGE